MTRSVGLTFPRDLDAWRRWQDRRHPLRLARGRARALVGGSGTPELVEVRRGGPDADLVVAVEAGHASVRSAVADVLRHLDPARVVVVCPPGLAVPDGPQGPAVRLAPDGLARALGTPTAVLATSHYTAVGAGTHCLARSGGAPFLVAQHGLLTPVAPPLPPEARLLAWSGDDADFWAAGRPDVAATTVGSQLLWSAAQAPVTADLDAPPVYLGQLHAAELSRTRLARAAVAFCRAHDATYRPHPSERDRVSRLLHAVWRRSGVRVDTGSVPLAELTAPVVSVFSTGVLEAAARGLPAWADFPGAPAWLREFWQRYDMRPYGGEPTPAPQRSEVEPALAIARLLETW